MYKRQRAIFGNFSSESGLPRHRKMLGLFLCAEEKLRRRFEPARKGVVGSVSAQFLAALQGRRGVCSRVARDAKPLRTFLRERFAPTSKDVGAFSFCGGEIAEALQPRLNIKMPQAPRQPSLFPCQGEDGRWGCTRTATQKTNSPA
jgi:hypothetical protein